MAPGDKSYSCVLTLAAWPLAAQELLGSKKLLGAAAENPSIQTPSFRVSLLKGLEADSKMQVHLIISNSPHLDHTWIVVPDTMHGSS